MNVQIPHTIDGVPRIRVPSKRAIHGDTINQSARVAGGTACQLDLAGATDHRDANDPTNFLIVLYHRADLAERGEAW